MNQHPDTMKVGAAFTARRSRYDTRALYENRGDRVYYTRPGGVLRKGQHYCRRMSVDGWKKWVRGAVRTPARDKRS